MVTGNGPKIIWKPLLEDYDGPQLSGEDSELKSPQNISHRNYYSIRKLERLSKCDTALTFLRN